MRWRGPGHRAALPSTPLAGRVADRLTSAPAAAPRYAMHAAECRPRKGTPKSGTGEKSRDGVTRLTSGADYLCRNLPCHCYEITRLPARVHGSDDAALGGCVDHIQHHDDHDGGEWR